MRILQVLREDPDTLELDMTMDLSQLHIDSRKVTGVPGYKNTLAQAGRACASHRRDVLASQRMAGAPFGPFLPRETVGAYARCTGIALVAASTWIVESSGLALTG